MRIVDVETRTVEGQSAALGTAGGATLVVDLPTEADGSGRGFGEEELLCLAMAASTSNGLFRTARAQHLELTRVVVRVRGVFPEAAAGTGGVSAGGDTPVEHVEYDVEVAGNARPESLRGLVDACEQTGAVANLLRRAVPVRRGRVAVRSEFPVRTLDEVLAVCHFMESWPGPWWVAGGWAIDLWAGGASREHEDIELAVPRRDQAALRALVADWRSYTPKLNRWAPMDDGEVLEPPRAMWQLRRTPGTRVPVDGMPPRWEFVLTEIEGGEWRFALDPSVRLPLERVVVRSPLGPPVASPEIVLLHKAFNDPPRPKDDHDFLWVRERLSEAQRGWLRAHLERLLPAHRWLPRLA
jgi:hypothetical protein